MKRREVKRGIRLTGAEHEEILCRLGAGSSKHGARVVWRNSRLIPTQTWTPTC